MSRKIDHICEECGTHHLVRRADLKRGWGRFCGKSCAAKNRERRLDRDNRQGLRVEKAPVIQRPGGDLLEMLDRKMATSYSWLEDESPNKDW